VKKGSQSRKGGPFKDGEIKQLSGLQMPAIAVGIWISQDQAQIQILTHTLSHMCRAQTVGANNSDKTEMRMKKTSEN